MRRKNDKFIQSLPKYGLGSWIKDTVKDIGEATGLKKVADWGGEVVGEDIRGAVKGVTGTIADVAGDSATLMVDNTLGIVGAGDLIGGDAYETGVGRSVSNITSKYVAPIAGQVVANTVAPGVGGAVLGGVQQGIGSGIAQKQQRQQQQQLMKQQQAAMNRQMLTQNRLNSLNRGGNYGYAPTFKNGGILSSYPNGGTIQGLGIGQLPTETVEAPTKFDTRPVYRQHIAKMSPGLIDAVRRQSNATTNEDLQEAFNRLYTKGPNTQYLAGNNSVYQITRRGEPLYQQVERSPGMGNYRNIDFNNNPLSEEEIIDIFSEQYESVYPDKNTYSNQMNLQKEVAEFADIPGLNLGMDNREGYEYYAKGGSIKIDPSKRGTFKAQATKMGMGVQEAASKILNAPKGKYSPAMRKKANFAKNFAKANGGYLEESRYNQDVTTYASGGSTHETSPYGGIPIGNKGSVESGEVRYGDYIFSDRF